MVTPDGGQRPSEALATNVRDYRAIHRIKQREVADHMRRLGHRWHPKTVSLVESGSRPVTTDELVALALVLRTTVAELLEPDPAWKHRTLDEDSYVGDDPNGYVLGDPEDEGVALPLAYARMVARSQVPIGFDGAAVDLPRASPYFEVYDHYGVEVEGMDQWRERTKARKERDQ